MNNDITSLRFLRDLLPLSRSSPTHPDGVLSHPDLRIGEKRELLAAWASDSCAVQDVPSLRQLENGQVVKLDEILQALKSLDVEGNNNTSDRKLDWPQAKWVRRQMQPWPFSSGKTQRNRRDDGDDDDDTPPLPAAVFPVPPPPRPLVDAA